MSLYGVTKGTELDKQIDKLLDGETRAVGMYHGLARLAKEQGLNDVADALLRVANDEARHAGLFTVLNAHVPPEIFDVLGPVAEIESNAAKGIKALAQKARDLGFNEVAREIELVAEDEGRHGQALQELVKMHGRK
jgi:rubrerythrin